MQLPVHNESGTPFNNGFPRDFFWGAATASYQVEGGIENNDWAQAARDGKVPVCDRSTNHFELFEKDFDIAQNLAHNAHRFSIEWSRVEPDEGKFDLEAIGHYKAVLAALKVRGITPLVTLWHFTQPIWFSNQGGFHHKKGPETFARYCEFVAEQLQGQVEYIITINEPLVWASAGYLKGKWPPFGMNPFSFLKVVTQLIRAHNLSYEKIKAVSPDFNVGIAKHNIYFFSNTHIWNKKAANFMSWFWNRRFLEGIKKHQDFIGLNFYFAKRFGKKISTVKSDMGWDIFPEGIYHTLMELKHYGKPVIITENGIADHADILRGSFIRDSLTFVKKALNEGVDVKGYFYWSLLDNYEWSFGFTERFGLVEVDYQTLERVVRPSALIYKEIILHGL